MAGNTGRLTDGSLSWDGGVSSDVVPTISGPLNPNGLKRNQLHWLNSATVRTAGISPRPGWVYRATMPVQGRFQRGQMYEPDNAYPYLIFQIEGRTFRCRVDTDFSVDEITIPGDPNPADVERAFFCQGEQFMVQQPGDLVKPPQWWDGVNMTRSRGLINTTLPGVAFVVPSRGTPVLATLSAAYGGLDGQLYYINGYQYRQVLFGQRYEMFLETDSPSVPFANDDFYVEFPAGMTFENNDPTKPGNTLAAEMVPLFNPFNPNGARPAGFFYAFLSGAALPPDQFTTYFNFPTPDRTLGRTRFNTTAAAPLAAPGVNQVWLINIDDPRAGFSVNTVGNQSQLPSGESMDYYMGRMWIAAGREYLAGDIVGNENPATGGSPIYSFRDSILNMTENLFTVGGGAFIVPSSAGNIRCLRHPANIDTALGEGQLKVFTRKSVYSVNVTPDRASWAALAEPIQRVEQINYGAMGDDAVIPVSGDLYYRSVDGARTLLQGIRYFGQPGNTPISHEESRAFDADDKALLHMCSGILFENRLLVTCLPYQTPYGVAHKGISPLNFDALSSMDNKLPPVWEGVWEGLNVMQLWQGDFGGRERAFAMVYSSAGQLEIWEMLSSERFDQNLTGEARISWALETPSYTADKVFTLKELDTLELWIDRLYGTVDFTVYLRADQAPCWTFWHHWQECGARNECELLQPPAPCDYPQQQYQPQYRATMILPKPPTSCISGNAQPGGNRPVNIGFAHQFKIVIQGYCRIRGVLCHWTERDRQPYAGITC